MDSDHEEVNELLDQVQEDIFEQQQNMNDKPSKKRKQPERRSKNKKSNAGFKQIDQANPDAVNISHSELFQAIRSANPNLFVELRNIAQWKTVLLAMQNTKASEVVFRFEPDELLIYAWLNTANILCSVWTKEMFTNYQVKNDNGIQLFAITSKDLKSLVKTIDRDDILVMSSCLTGGDTAFYNTLVTTVPDAPAIITNIPVPFETVDESSIPDLKILQMGEWNVTLSSKLFASLMDKVSPAPDYIQLSIKPEKFELAAYDVKQRTKDVHIDINSNQTFEGYFDECQLAAITKCASLNESLILKWVQLPGSDCLIATYNIRMGEITNKESHLSYIIGLKSLE